MHARLVFFFKNYLFIFSFAYVFICCYSLSPPSAVKVTGAIKIHVHYYEDGNVQLTTDMTKPITIPDKGVSHSFMIKYIFIYLFTHTHVYVLFMY